MVRWSEFLEGSKSVGEYVSLLGGIRMIYR